MWNFIKDVLKGMVIGIANVIPGVSGGTMAVAMGIYDKMIHAITHVFKEFKKSLKVLLPILIGMVISIVAASKGIEWMYAVIPIQTTGLFIGLIVGGLPSVFKRIKGNKVKWGHILAMIVMFAIVLGLAFVTAENEADTSFTFLNVIKLLLAGVVASATMVIPGVSGSMMMMLMGYYHTIIGSISTLADSLVPFQTDGILGACAILVPFAIGAVIGIVVIAKLIEMIFQKCPMYAYFAIIGLIAASPFAIIVVGVLGSAFPALTVLAAVTAVIAAAVGFVIALLLGQE